MAHFALQKLHILPSQLANMSKKEKLLVYASILHRVEAEKREQDKLDKMKNKSSGRRRW